MSVHLTLDVPNAPSGLGHAGVQYRQKMGGILPLALLEASATDVDNDPSRNASGATPDDSRDPSSNVAAVIIAGSAPSVQGRRVAQVHTASMSPQLGLTMPAPSPFSSV